MISTETITKFQAFGIRFLVVPSFTTDGPALDITLEYGQGNASCRWCGRAMAPELVDKCIQRGLPTMQQRMDLLRRVPEHTQR